MYIDKLNNIGNKYNNAYHSTTKIKAADVKHKHTYFNEKNSKKDPKLNVGDPVKYQDIKNVLQKVTLQDGLTKTMQKRYLFITSKKCKYNIKNILTLLLTAELISWLFC